MKGYIPVEIPTKRYVKAYIIFKLGTQPLMLQENKFGKKFHSLLEKKTNERRKEFANARYNERLRVFIPMHTFRQRGCNLNETNIKDFNLFIEKELKEQFYFLMDLYCELLPSFTANLPTVRQKLGIDLEAWDDDSMRKDYYRYRLENNLPLFYDKNFTRTVPSTAYVHAAW